MTTLEVFNPSDSSEKVEHFEFAPRLADLNSKTICELSNDRCEYRRTFPLIRQLLRKRYPDIKLVPYTKFPIGIEAIDIDNIGDMVAEKGCDAVIAGNAG